MLSWYYFHYAPALLALLVSLLLARRISNARAWRVMLLSTAWLMLPLVCALMAAKIAVAPSDEWAGSRLAPIVSLVHAGGKLYYPAGEGPVLVRMYGPVSSLVYLPVALAQRPSAAVFIGTAISFTILLVPLIWLLGTCCRDDQGRAPTRSILFVAIVTFAIVGCLSLFLPDIAGTVAIDSPAIGFAAAAMVVLIRSDSAIRGGIWCGLLAGLSVWSKQTLLPFIGALIIYSLLSRGWRWSGRYTLVMLLVLVAVSAIVFAACGPRAAWFNMWTIPMSQPLYWPWLSRTTAIIRVSKIMLWATSLAGWLLLAGVLLKFVGRAAGTRGAESESESEPGPSHSGNWFARNVWLLPLLGALLVLPVGAAAAAKTAGALTNNRAPTSCFAYIAAVGLLCSLIRCIPQDGPTLRQRFAYLALIETMIGVAVVPLLSRSPVGPKQELISLPHRLIEPFRSSSRPDCEIAFDYMRAHPGEVYFPSLPLASLLAESRTYHSDQGLADLARAHIAVTPQQLETGLPPRLRAVIFKRGALDSPIRKLLPQFTCQIHPAGLPGDWVVLIRPGDDFGSKP